MRRSLILAIWLAAGFSRPASFAGESGYSQEFSTENGNRIVRTITGQNGGADLAAERRLPIRNPHILAQVLWVDRNHENAIAENVSVTPDGSGTFAGWWLNNERFSAYASAGLESPLWAYREESDWQMPVGSSNTRFGGTGAGLPAYIWDDDSPLFRERLAFDAGYSGSGVAFSGDGSLVAVTAAAGGTDAVLIVYDIIAGDTVFTRRFVPSNGQYGVDISDDGSTVVVSNYGGLLVYSVPEGDLLGTLYNYSQNTAKVSGDGGRIIIGTFNGAVFLHQWDGSQYTQVWSRPTGDDWVTAVDISTDGSTVACGTLDFQSGQIAGGKFMEWDAATGDPLIDYDEYGDAVGGVALSGDGQYAMAGSWGQYGSTFGDVVTCFFRGLDIPIFQLLDDIDEPGSIFDVAISESGRYAAAGGKAVHAREWGNGGMLYSIMIRDLLTNDVAVASIDEPGEFVNPGEDVIPTATYINVGTANASFVGRCIVTNIDTGEEIYNSSYDTENLPSFSTSIVYFSPHFTMPGEGRFRMEFTAEMDGDEDPTNNQLGLVLRSWHDMKAVAVVSPFDDITLNWPFSGIGTFRNLGSYYETVDIEMHIYDESENVVFSTVSTIYSLGPYMSEDVYFESWVPETAGEYRAEFNVILEDDFFPDDNTMSKTFQVVNEMIYDDGNADISIWVNLYPYSANRKFAQIFAPNIATPYRITDFRVFIAPINYDGYFDYFAVTGDTEGLPDTINYISVIENPELSGPGNWSDFQTDINIEDDRPLWVVLHWPDRDDMGPFIGADNTGEMNQRSYWYADGENWNLYPWADWMIRMTLQEQTGAEYEYISGLPDRIALFQNYPNPFNPSTTIEFALPNESQTIIEIYNVLGARVKILTGDHFEAGYHTAIWDGTNDAGNEVSSGVYYYRLTAGDYRVSRKMMLLR